MSQESRRPARSLRENGKSKYYRDWSAEEARHHTASEVGADELDEIISSQAPEEMKMVDVLADEEPQPPLAAPLSAAAVPPVGQEMAPLNVIVPTEAPQPKTPEKPKVTRMDRTKLQRARRYSELKAEEEQKRKEAEAAAAAEAEARREANKASPPEQSAKTRSLPQNHTTQLQSNLQNVNEKLDQTRENVKTTADALSQNIRELSDKITVKVVGSVQGLSKTLNRWINRIGKNTEPVARETDFEDAPIAEEASSQAMPQNAPAEAAESAPKDPLAHILRVPAVQYADLLRENVFFQDYNKAPLVDSPEALKSYASEDLQRAFVEAALQDIRRCVKLVRDLPDPKEGPYTGLPVAYIFKHVSENDLFFFMHYVLSKPGPFAKKTFKISEAFGTWILKRSAITVVAEPFPDVPVLAYYPLYQRNIRFVTRDRKALVLAGSKTPEAFEAEFLERGIDDIRHCVPLVENFPPTEQGPYKQRPLRQIFRYVQERDIHFFLHYVKDNPDVFQGQNFKFAEAFASWILKRSHETQLSQ